MRNIKIKYMIGLLRENNKTYKYFYNKELKEIYIDSKTIIYNLLEITKESLKFNKIYIEKGYYNYREIKEIINECLRICRDKNKEIEIRRFIKRLDKIYNKINKENTINII